MALTKLNNQSIGPISEFNNPVSFNSAITTAGGIYLGGTGAANYLDDYEEGTFTPFVYGNTTTGSGSGTLVGVYTKVGNLVICVIRFAAFTFSGGSGYLLLGGLPFTGASTSPGGGFAQYIEGFNPAYTSTPDTDSNTLTLRVDASGSTATFRPSVTPNWDNYLNAATTTWTGGGGSTYGEIVVTYRTA